MLACTYASYGTFRRFSIGALACASLACTSPGIVTGNVAAKPGLPDSATAATITSPIAPADVVPLAPSAPAPAAAAVGTERTPAASGPGSGNGRVEANPNVSSPEPAGTPGNANAVPLPPPTPEGPVLAGDTNRFRYAFFTTRDNYEIGSVGVVPFFGAVFTDDPNYCTRTATPLRKRELTVYQLSSSSDYTLDGNVVYNVVTSPDVVGMRTAWWGNDRPEGYDKVGWQGTCVLMSVPVLPTSFAQASWTLTPPPGESLTTAQKVQIDLHARNDAQEIVWSLQAQRCADAWNSFQSYGGNHFFDRELPCVRAEADPSDLVSGTVASPNNVTP